MLLVQIQGHKTLVNTMKSRYAAVNGPGTQQLKPTIAKCEQAKK